MNQISAILVEDNPSALQLLQDDIARNHQALNVVGTATSVV